MNIEILKESNIKDKYIILAAHSGNNNNTFFNDLIYLKTNDIIYLKYKEYEDKYKVFKQYYINKTGFLELDNNNKNKLILITCSRKMKNKQLIIEANLIE